MTVAFQRMFGILEPWNNNQVTPSLSKPHELSYRPNTIFLTRQLRKIFSPSKIEDPAESLWKMAFGQFFYNFGK